MTKGHFYQINCLDPVTILHIRGVGTTAAGTAMAVPLFQIIIQKTAAGCYFCCEVRLRSAEELDRVVAARSTLTNKRP